MIYNLDTCIIIEILRSNKIVCEQLNAATNANDIIAISQIAYYEVMRGFDLNLKCAARKQVIFEQIYDEAAHLLLNEKSLYIAAEIYRYLCKRGQKIEDDDIFIAAITLANDATLLTDNVKHFERVPNLKVVNWKDLGD